MSAWDGRDDRGDAAARTAATAALTDEIIRMVRLIKAASELHGATDRAALLLLLPLKHAGPMRLRELAHAKGVDPSTVSRQVAQLVHAGLVTSEPDPRDGRARRLRLTAAGRGQCERLVQASCHAIGQALHDWSDAKIAQFTALFQEFNGRVEERTPPLQRSGLEPTMIQETT